MTNEEYNKFIHETQLYLMELQERHKAEYGMGDYERWDLDQNAGEIIFSDGGVPKIITEIQVVGSLSNISNTWLWSWANSSILEPLKREMNLVRQFGEERGITKLVEAKWPADESDGWTMTSITAQLIRAKGAYRCPTGNGYLFVVFTEIKRVVTA
jgi:hypothetical protein